MKIRRSSTRILATVLLAAAALAALACLAGCGRLTTEPGHTIDFAAELPVVLIYEIESAGIILRHEGYDLNIERVVTAAIDEFTGRRPTR